jgi:hypothetical protein
VTISTFVRVYFRLFALSVLFAGAALFLVGLGFAIQNWSFLRHAEAADGTVTDVVLVHDYQDRSDTYRPVFTFKTRDGATYRVQSEAGSAPSHFQVGQQVDVIFDPKTPDAAQINSIGQLWIFPLVFIGIGATAFGCGLIAARILARRTRQPMLGGLKTDLATIRSAIRSWGFS